MSSRSKILSAASDLFLEGGASALSVRAIAKQAGLSTIGIYSHFQGKQGILDALYIEGFNYVYAAMSVPASQPMTLEDVMQAAQGYLEVAQHHEAHYRLIFGEGDAGYQPSDEARAAGDRAFAKLVSHTGEFLNSAGLKTERRVAAMNIWAILHGYVSISHHPLAKQDWDWASMALDAVRAHLNALQ